MKEVVPKTSRWRGSDATQSRRRYKLNPTTDDCIYAARRNILPVYPAQIRG